MQLERVGTVAMCGFSLQIGGEVDDLDGIERTLLHANTASDAQLFRDERYLGSRCYFNTQLPYLVYGAVCLAFLLALLGLASLLADYCNTVRSFVFPTLRILRLFLLLWRHT